MLLATQYFFPLLLLASALMLPVLVRRFFLKSYLLETRKFLEVMNFPKPSSVEILRNKFPGLYL